MNDRSWPEAAITLRRWLDAQKRTLQTSAHPRKRPFRCNAGLVPESGRRKRPLISETGHSAVKFGFCPEADAPNVGFGAKAMGWTPPDGI